MKIFCIGRNYSEHAKEMQHDIPTSPVVFMKPSTSLLKGNIFYLPEFSKEIHYECELVYRISKNGKHIDEKFAAKYYDAITVGIDFTARDLQSDCKKKGLPWEIAKAFDNSAVLGEWMATSSLKNSSQLKFSLKKNEVTAQSGNSDEMIFNIHKIINYISTFFTLQQGDLIYTGTPAGVGAVKSNDHLEGFLEGDKKFELTVK